MNLVHLEKIVRTRLDDVLVEEGVLDKAQVEEALAVQERTGKQLGEILVTTEKLPDYDLAKVVVANYPMPFLDIAGFTTRREVVQLLPEDFCRRNGVLPLDQFGGTMTLAVCEPPSMELLEDIATRTKLTPYLYVVVRRALFDTLDQSSANKGKTPPARAKTVVGAPKPAAPAASPAKAAPADEPEPESAPAEEAPAQPFPDLVLPRVSMRLVGGAPGTPKAPPPPARPGARSAVVPRPQSAAAPEGAPSPAAGLSWMDQAAAAAAQPARPVVQTFQRKTSAPPTPAAPAKPGEWASVFDAGEEVVKRETSAGGKLPKPPAK